MLRGILICGLLAVSASLLQAQAYFTSTTDSTGSRYRKIGLNGFPIPDEKPQQRPESDQEDEETYIDSFNLTLTHQVTDVYIPFEGTDLALTVRRNWSSEVWNLGGGLRPDNNYFVGPPFPGAQIKRPDRPFGGGWRTNLGANIQFEHSYISNEQSYAYVTDDEGTTYRFLMCLILKPDGTVELQFFPMPEHRHQQEVLATTLTRQPDKVTYVFKKKFGTTLTYKLSSYWDEAHRGELDQASFNQRDINQQSLQLGEADECRGPVWHDVELRVSD